MGYADSEQFHIFELTKQLPKFAMYTVAPTTLAKPKDNNFVTFKITERVQRICIWLNQNFLFENALEIDNEDTKELHVNLISLRDKNRLDLDFEADGQVKISTSDIRLAGDLVQSLATYLNLSDLQVRFFYSMKKMKFCNYV